MGNIQTNCGYMKHLFSNSRRSRTGFTLLELIIAMAVIAIVTTALWGNFFTSLQKGRDNRRKQDIELVTKALELYYTDNRIYPTTLPAWGSTFANDNNVSVIYMQKLPTDPSYPNQNYCYTSDSTGSLYKIYANLENRNDPKAFVNTVLCGTVWYNYGISSSNTTP